MITITIKSDHRAEGKTTLASMLRWFFNNFTKYNVIYEEVGGTSGFYSRADTYADSWNPRRLQALDVRAISIKVEL